MMGTRLEKLEKDLYFLSAMHELFLANSSEFSSNLNNASDSNSKGAEKKNNPRQSKKQCNLNVVADNGKSCKKTNNVFNKGKDDTDSTAKAETEDDDPDFRDKIADLELEIARVKEELEIERRKRAELEDSGRQVALQLQKADDELLRQIDTKKGLLIGTLQLKSQLQGYESRINQLELEISNVKNEKQRLSHELDAITREKQNLKQEIESKTAEFQRLDVSVHSENMTLKQEVEKLLSNQRDMKLQLEITEQGASKHSQKLINQLNQMLVKYVQLEREREALCSELQKAKSCSSTAEAELLEFQESLAKLNAEHKTSQTEHNSVLKSLKSEMERKNFQTNQQMSSCRALLSQTKNLLNQLKNQKFEGQGSIADLRSENFRLASTLEEKNGRIHALEQEKQLLQDRLRLLMSQKTKTINNLQKSNEKLQISVKNLKVDKRMLEKGAAEFKEMYEKQMKELEGRETESCAARKELSNIKENFQILQKISQDQMNSIQKLKSERDADRKSKSDLETQLRENELKEASLLIKLESEERKSVQLEDEIEYLEGKLSGMERELKDHSCERFVESTCRNRVQELEKTVRLRYSEWESSMASIKAERDRALAAARKATNTAEEMKTSYETRVLEILSGTKQENSRLQAENQRIIAEKSSKIYEMESEMVKFRQMSENSQRNLTARIQQLQAALNLCLGGGGPNLGQNLGLPGMNGFGFNI